MNLSSISGLNEGIGDSGSVYNDTGDEEAGKNGISKEK